jgi:hypothetical protein
MSNTGEARILLEEPGHLIVRAWKNVLVFVWTGDAPVALMRKLGPLLAAHAREVGRVSIVSVVAKISELPDESRRHAYKEFYATHSADIGHQVIVIEREGFMGSAVRGLITGLLLVTRQHFMVHVTSTVEEVASWLPAKHAAATSVVLDPAELTKMLLAVRGAALNRP